MPKVAIVSDSTCDMPAGWPWRQRVHILPVHILFGGESFREGVEIDEVTFYARVEAEGAIPTTSQPSPGEFADLYRTLSAEHDAIISMHVTARLSGTYQSAQLAAEMVKDEIEVHAFDSACGAIGLGFMAREALELLDQGQPVSQVLERLAQVRDRMNIFLSPDNLKYAQMSGRVSALGSAMASLLSIKPIVALNQGMLAADERVRTRERALRRLVERMQERVGPAPAQVGVAHARAEKDAQRLADMAAQVFNCDQVWLTSLATSVAVHLGPGTVGLVAYAS